MAFTNYDTKEINCKIVYFGPKSSGKTANLRSVFKQTSEDIRSGLIELDTDRSDAQFFEFLPVSIGKLGDFHLKMHLYAVNLQSSYESVMSVLLKGIDGYVFVADSRVESMIDNVETLATMKRLMSEEGINHQDLPKVIQYNKRDFSDIIPVDIMRQDLNPTGAKDHEAVAVDAKGTMETVHSLSKLIIERFGATKN